MSDNLDGVVILGGGFTGLFAALSLRNNGYDGPITLIDRETRFIFRPLLYDLLSREVQVDMVWPRYDELLLPRDITFITGEITGVDLDKQVVTLESGLTYSYQYLVLSLGNTAGFFGVPGAEAHAMTFRSAEDAFELGKHIRHCLQQAQQGDAERLLTFTIVGGGPSGIELAATLGDLLPRWYENLNGDIGKLRIAIIQRGDEILQSCDSQDVQKVAHDALNERRTSAEVILNASVISVTPRGVDYTQGDETIHLPSETVIWTAGNAINPVVEQLSIPAEHRDRYHRLKVKSTLQLFDYTNVFAGGDCAVVEADPQPATAQVAYQQGQAIAANIAALTQDKPLQDAQVNLRGTLLKLGMHTGLASIFDKYDVQGQMAHLIRQGVYLNLLPTPARNLKQDAQWLTEEVFEQVLNA